MSKKLRTNAGDTILVKSEPVEVDLYHGVTKGPPSEDELIQIMMTFLSKGGPVGITLEQIQQHMLQFCEANATAMVINALLAGHKIAMFTIGESKVERFKLVSEKDGSK